MNVWFVQSHAVDVDRAARGQHGVARLTVRAAGPTARPPHSFAHFIEADSYAAFSRLIFLCGCHPADPLVASQWCNVGPDVLHNGVRLDCFAEICRQFVKHWVGKFRHEIGRVPCCGPRIFAQKGVVCGPGGRTTACAVVFARSSTSSLRRLKMKFATPACSSSGKFRALPIPRRQTRKHSTAQCERFPRKAVRVTQR